MVRKNVLLMSGAVVVVAAVALTVVLAGGGSDGPPPAASPTSEPRPKPELKPLELEPSAVWQQEDMWPVRNTGGVQLLDGALLTATSKSIALVDIATGQPRWTQLDDAELSGGGAEFDRASSEQPYLVHHQNGLGVVVTYRSGDCEAWEQGLALLSGADGSVVWRTPTAPSDPCEPNHWGQFLFAADDTTAVVEVGPQFGSPQDPALMRTVAIDVATGAKKWELAGVRPYGITGDTLITTTEGARRATPETGTATMGLPVTATGQVAAVDLRTGAPRWSLADRFAAAEVLHTAGNVVAVLTAGERKEPSTVRLLDAGTGQEIAELGASTELGRCATDAHDLIACGSDVDRETLVTFSVEDHSVRRERTTEPVSLLTAVVDGRISVQTLDPIRRVTVDRAGNVIDTEPPGELVASVDGLAVFHFTDEGGREHTEVHKIAG